MNQALLVLHILGTAMGLSVSFANLVMASLVAKAAPNEKPILGRFPAAMMRVGDIGLALLLTTGPILLVTKYQGFAGMPWTFHVKLTAVVILIGCVGFIHANMRKVAAGDLAALKRVQTVGPIAMLSAITAVVFAVMTFTKS